MNLIIAILFQLAAIWCFGGFESNISAWRVFTGCMAMCAFADHMRQYVDDKDI